VLSEDPVGEEMGGNAIRAYELAKALAGEARVEVVLAAPVRGRPPQEIALVDFDREDPTALSRHLRGVDVVLALPQNPVVAAVLGRSGARVVYDLYDPKPLQMLEAHTGSTALKRRYWSTIALDHVLEALAGADYLICASERQRDMWLGAMLASRLITPAVYDADPTLRSVIDVVPFGVPDLAPQTGGPGPFERFATLDPDAEIVLWNGGLWNWLDPVCAVEAIALVLERRPKARLVFMGRPPGVAGQDRQAQAARALAERLGLLDRAVFFNDAWVPYGERGAWLARASCALSLHVEHLETRFSFRTRVLDCLWAQVPAVCTAGDELAELVSRRGLGAAVPPGDPVAVADAIVGVLEAGRAAYRDALAEVAEGYRWSAVAAPLVRYVLDPGATHRPRPPKLEAPLRRARALATRSARALGRAARRIS
jgi:glycosyltransferase involved in cell wall biosynthesis